MIKSLVAAAAFTLALTRYAFAQSTPPSTSLGWFPPARVLQNKRRSLPQNSSAWARKRRIELFAL